MHQVYKYESKGFTISGALHVKINMARPQIVEKYGDFADNDE